MVARWETYGLLTCGNAEKEPKLVQGRNKRYRPVTNVLVRALKGRNLQEQMKRSHTKPAEQEPEVGDSRTEEQKEAQARLKEDLDDVLDEIDELLGENEVQMAQNFVQKGGE